MSIIKARSFGKVVATIKESHRKQIPILIHNDYSVQDIKDIAKRLDLKIPEPLSMKDLRKSFYKNNLFDF